MNMRAAILRILPVLMAIGLFGAAPARAQDDITVEATLTRYAERSGQQNLRLRNSRVTTSPSCLTASCQIMHGVGLEPRPSQSRAAQPAIRE